VDNVEIGAYVLLLIPSVVAIGLLLMELLRMILNLIKQNRQGIYD
jgi:hypothetical protein